MFVLTIVLADYKGLRESFWLRASVFLGCSFRFGVYMPGHVELLF